MQRARLNTIVWVAGLLLGLACLGNVERAAFADRSEPQWLIRSVNAAEKVHLLSQSFTKTKPHNFTFIGMKVYDKVQQPPKDAVTYDEIRFEQEVDCKTQRMRPLQMAIYRNGTLVRQFKTLNWTPIGTDAWKQELLLPACKAFYPTLKS